jgi:hypothetical protein
MIDLPLNPDNIGADTMLARYLRADPARVKVLKIICDTLDDDGRVGDRSRYYVVRNPFRRDVLRGTLAALGIPIPSWACVNPAAKVANLEFMARYRAAHNERQRTWNATIPQGHPAHQRKLYRPSQCEWPQSQKDN